VLHDPDAFPANARRRKRPVRGAATQDRDAIWFCAGTKSASSHARQTSFWVPGIGASQCNTTLLPSTFNSVWSVCRMRKKFRDKIEGVFRSGALHGGRGAGAKKQYIGSRSQDFHARPVVGLCALRRVRAFGGCGGGPSRHTIAAQDAVRILIANRQTDWVP